MSTTKKVIIVVVILAVIGVGYYFWKKSKAKKATELASASPAMANVVAANTGLVSGVNPASQLA